VHGGDNILAISSVPTRHDIEAGRPCRWFQVLTHGLQLDIRVPLLSGSAHRLKTGNEDWVRIIGTSKRQFCFASTYHLFYQRSVLVRVIKFCESWKLRCGNGRDSAFSLAWHSFRACGSCFLCERNLLPSRHRTSVGSGPPDLPATVPVTLMPRHVCVPTGARFSAFGETRQSFKCTSECRQADVPRCHRSKR
jgi:hypothetical protein